MYDKERTRYDNTSHGLITWDSHVTRVYRPFMSRLGCSHHICNTDESHRKDTHNQICNQLDKRALRAKVEVVAEIFSTVLDEDASTDTEKVAALTDYLDELKIKSKDALAKLQHL